MPPDGWHPNEAAARTAATTVEGIVTTFTVGQGGAFLGEATGGYNLPNQDGSGIINAPGQLTNTSSARWIILALTPTSASNLRAVQQVGTATHASVELIAGTTFGVVTPGTTEYLNTNDDGWVRVIVPYQLVGNAIRLNLTAAQADAIAGLATTTVTLENVIHSSTVPNMYSISNNSIRVQTGVSTVDWGTTTVALEGSLWCSKTITPLNSTANTGEFDLRGNWDGPSVCSPMATQRASDGTITLIVDGELQVGTDSLRFNGATNTITGRGADGLTLDVESAGSTTGLVLGSNILNVNATTNLAINSSGKIVAGDVSGAGGNSGIRGIAGTFNTIQEADTMLFVNAINNLAHTTDNKLFTLTTDGTTVHEAAEGDIIVIRNQTSASYRIDPHDTQNIEGDTDGAIFEVPNIKTTITLLYTSSNLGWIVI